MEFNATQAIYKQIIDEYKKMLVRGEVKNGDKIASQRDYAQKQRINPNTVQRAYREMESIGMLETLRGQGSFISISEEKLMEIKDEMAAKNLQHFIEEMSSLGFQDQDIIKLLEYELKERQEKR